MSHPFAVVVEHMMGTHRAHVRNGAQLAMGRCGGQLEPYDGAAVVTDAPSLRELTEELQAPSTVEDPGRSDLVGIEPRALVDHGHVDAAPVGADLQPDHLVGPEPCVTHAVRHELAHEERRLLEDARTHDRSEPLDRLACTRGCVGVGGQRDLHIEHVEPHLIWATTHPAPASTGRGVRSEA
jgi:hypothetical protein